MSDTNIFSNIQRVGGQTLGNDDFYEVRVENDSSGNPLYLGRSPISNASTSEKIWFITKLYYDANSFLERVQQPNNGTGFLYAWDLRNTYFS